MKIVASPSSRILRVVPAFEFVGNITPTLTLRQVSGGVVSELVDKDAVLIRSAGGDSVTDYQLVLLSFGGVSSSGFFSSSNTSVATIDQLGFVSHVSDGVAVLSFSTQGKTVSLTLTFSTVNGAITFVLKEYVAGSLSEHISTGVDSRILNKNAGESLRIFTTQNHAGSLYVRNPNVWCADWDLSCFSPWNSSGGVTRAGTLISPRHIVFAAHYQLGVGASVRFVTMDNVVITRTLVNKLTHPDYRPYYPDITIGVLDADVPSSINFARVLPDNWTNYIPELGTIRTLPALTLDQEEKALVTDWFYDSNGFSSFRAPLKEKRIEFYEPKIGGDSGNPAFVWINNQLVILTVWTYGGAGSGTSIRYHKTAINAMMTALGGGYQLTEVDLSGFPTY